MTRCEHQEHGARDQRSPPRHARASCRKQACACSRRIVKEINDVVMAQVKPKQPGLCSDKFRHEFEWRPCFDVLERKSISRTTSWLEQAGARSRRSTPTIRPRRCASASARQFGQSSKPDRPLIFFQMRNTRRAKNSVCFLYGFANIRTRAKWKIGISPVLRRRARAPELGAGLA